jgi:hypothetical protein
MSTGIIICQNAGTSVLADDDGICQSQSVAAGASFTMNGSALSGGVFSNPGWGYKVKVTSAGNDLNKSFIFAGKFWDSASAGSYSETMTVTGANASSATSSLYATQITGVRVDTATAGAVTIGLAADSVGVPVGLNYGSLYQVNYGGTFAGATIQVKKYHALSASWLPFGTETGEASATVKNYELPAGTTVKAFVTLGSATSAIYIDAEIIAKQR